MKKRFTISDGVNHYSIIEDYTELVEEWIENGHNGTKEEVLQYMRDGTFSVYDKTSCAFGFFESFIQSDAAALLSGFLDENPWTVKVESV